MNTSKENDERARVCSRCGRQIVGSRSNLATLKTCAHCGGRLSEMTTLTITSLSAEADSKGASRTGPNDSNLKTDESPSPGIFVPNAADNPFGRPDDCLIADPSDSISKLANRQLEYALRMRDSSIIAKLPRHDGPGLFGRAFCTDTALQQMATLSKKQFQYEYLQNGRVSITNISRFGTVVNGQRLSRDPYTGIQESVVISAPAVIIMGGEIFDLIEVE